MSTSPKKNLGQLYAALLANDLPVLASVLKKVFGDRTPKDHAEWDKSTRQPARDRIVEALGEGIHKPPNQAVEIPPNELRTLDELPGIDCGPIADTDNDETRALEVVGAIERDGRRVLVRDPPRLLSGLTALTAEPSTWEAFGKQVRQLRFKNLYREVVAPVRAKLQRAASHYNLLWLYCQTSRLYRVRVRNVDAKDIYIGAADFVSSAGAGTALTNSTTSGVIDPIERLGTIALLQALEVEPESPIGKRLRKKDAWRILNFRDGLLNPQFQARRPYFFDRTTTAKALRATIELLPDEKRLVYRDLAAQHLAEAVGCPGFELYEVKAFEPWMWRYTRSAPGHVLISFRHPDTRAISEGLELNFENPQKMHEFYSFVFGIGGLIAPAIWSPLTLPVIAAGGLLEQRAFHGIEYSVLHAEAEDDIRKHARRIRVDGFTDDERMADARAYIESLLEEEV